MDEKSISRKMAEFAVRLKFEDLPEGVILQVKRYLFDSIGCAYGAMNAKDVQILSSLYREMGGAPEATLIGYGDRIPAMNAALVNSHMIRALDFNDIYWKEDPCHPSDLIPAALSAGEKVGASMREAITAIVLAYEFEQRLSEFALPGFRERKWHHATITQLASPVAAGKMLQLSVDEMVHAVGISGCHNHTIGCPTAGKLTMMKNTVDPMAVQSGVQAALMAQKGYSGTEAIFEGKEGVMDVYGPDWDASKLTEGLGESYRILSCSMKAFPTEALTHTHLTAVLKIVRGNKIPYDQIESVTVTTIARACDILFDPQKYRPQSRETADHSLPFCIAAALVDHKVTTASFADEKLKDPRIWEVIDKIKGEASEEFEKMFPEKQPSKVVIRTTGGQTFEEYLEYPKGDPREPMSDQDLEDKFKSLSSHCLDADRQDQIRDLIYHCEDLSIRELMMQLKL